MSTPKNEVKMNSKPAFWYTVQNGKLHRSPSEGESPDGKNEKGYEFIESRAVKGRITGVGIDEKTHSTGVFHIVSLKVETEEEVSFVQCNFSGGGYAKNLMERLKTIEAKDAFSDEFVVGPYEMEFTPEGTTEKRMAKGFSLKGPEGWKVEKTELNLPSGKEVKVKKELVWDDTEAREILMNLYEDMKKALLDMNKKPDAPLPTLEEVLGNEGMGPEPEH